MKEAGDRLSRESDFGDATFDDAEDGASTDGDEDEVPREKLLVGRIGECAATLAIDFSWYYLEKHIAIIA